MFEYDNINSYENENEPYPDFFLKWDETVREGKSPGYYEPEELTEIIEIYLDEKEHKEAMQAIEYALKIYATDEDLLYEILLLLNDYEQWNDLLVLCDYYEKTAGVWGNGHKLTALLHLRMEEEAFHFFGKTKDIYTDDEESLNVIYQAMAESLIDMDLYESSIEVINEAIEAIGENIDFYWLQLQSFAALDEKEAVSKLADKIQKMDPLNADAWHRLGIAFQEVNDWDKAIDAFEYAHSLNSSSGNNIMSLVYAYEKNGNYNKALEKIKEFLLLYPENYPVSIVASKICSQIEHWEEAIKFINDALKIVPDIDILYMYKSSFFLHLEEYKKAKLTLEEGIEKTDDPDGELAKELYRLNEQYPFF